MRQDRKMAMHVNQKWQGHKLAEAKLQQEKLIIGSQRSLACSSTYVAERSQAPYRT